MDNLTCLDWETFKSWLLYDRKLSNKRSALDATHSRFKQLKVYFADQPLTRREFTIFISRLKDKGISNGTCNKYISLVKLLSKYLNLTGFEDLTYFKTPRKKEVDALSWQEMRAIAEVKLPYRMNKEGLSAQAQNDRAYSLYRLLGETGCRIGEALELEWEDLEGRQLTFKDTKNGDDRTVLVSTELSLSLASLPHLNSKVFNLSSEGSVNLDLKRRADLLGIQKQVYPHVFRHSVATNLLGDGAPLVYVQELLGHRDVNTTIRYTHNTLQEMENMLFTYSGWWKSSQSFSSLAKRVSEVVQTMVGASHHLSIEQSEGKLVLKIKNGSMDRGSDHH